MIAAVPGAQRATGSRRRSSGPTECGYLRQVRAVFRVRPPTEEEELAPEAAAAPPPAAREPAEELADTAVRSAPARPPSAPPEPAGELVLVGMPEAEVGKELEVALRAWGLGAVVVTDGVEAMLEIQRKLPRVAVLSRGCAQCTASRSARS